MTLDCAGISLANSLSCSSILASQALSSALNLWRNALSEGFTVPFACRMTILFLMNLRRSFTTACSSSLSCRRYCATWWETSSSTWLTICFLCSFKESSESESSRVAIWHSNSLRSCWTACVTISPSSWQRCCKANRCSAVYARFRLRSSSLCSSCRTFSALSSILWQRLLYRKPSEMASSVISSSFWACPAGVVPAPFAAFGLSSGGRGGKSAAEAPDGSSQDAATELTRSTRR